LFQGTISELHDLSKPSVKIETNNQEKTMTVLTNAGIDILQSDAQTISVVFKTKEEMGSMNALLVQNGISVFSIGKERKDLENLFLDITSKN
jgi:ABC-2 type transport system ATP-binding protein